MSADEPNPESSLASALRGRMERGELPRDRLTLARALGHAPSGVALGRATPTDDEALDPDASLEYWGRRLGRWGPVVMIRVGAILSRAVADQSDLPREVAVALDAGLVVAERFLARSAGAYDGGDPLGDACARSAREVARLAVTFDAESAAQRACLVLLPLLRAVGDLVSQGAPSRDVLRAHYLRTLEHAEASPVDQDRLREAIRSSLVAWAVEP